MNSVSLHHLHIHKTAGTSFAGFLAEHVPADSICPWRFEHQAVRDNQARAYGLYTGHLSIPLINQRAPGARLITILRDPRERLLSAYAHWRRHAVAKHDQVKAGRGFLGRFLNLSLEEFLRSDEPVLRGACDNVIARLLAGGRFGDGRSTRAQVTGPASTDTGIVQQAIETLERSLFFGFSDNLDEAQQMLAGILKWPIQPAARLNMAPDQRHLSGLSEGILTLLNNRTELDREVYSVARNLYQLRFSKG